MYSDDMKLKEKVEAVATKIYRADAVTFSGEASSAIKKIEKMGFVLLGAVGVQFHVLFRLWGKGGVWGGKS